MGLIGSLVLMAWKFDGTAVQLTSNCTLSEGSGDYSVSIPPANLHRDPWCWCPLHSASWFSAYLSQASSIPPGPTRSLWPGARASYRAANTRARQILLRNHKQDAFTSYNF